ncbi:hypothetical protein BJ912DRAFT_1128989 [Pholiota molesta]|nr:hypothetical protein BJ912DRAFT_1128989 [Pholiota molesta]
MSMAEMRRSRRSDPHPPPKTLDPADSPQSNASMQAPMGRQRAAAAAAVATTTTTTTTQGTVSDDDDDGIAPLEAFDAAGKALDDEDGILEIDDGDRTFGHNEIMGFESDGGGGDDNNDVPEDPGFSRTMAKVRRSTRPAVGARHPPKAFDSPDLPQDGPPVRTAMGRQSVTAAAAALMPSTSMSTSARSDDDDDGNAPLDGIDTAGKVVDDETGILQLGGGTRVFGRDEDMGSERDGGCEDGDEVRGRRVGSSDDEDGGNAPLDATSGVPPIRDIGFPTFATEYSTSTDSRGAPASGGGCGNDDDDAVPENDVARFNDNVDGNALLGGRVAEDCKDGADVETEANDDDAAADDDDDDGGPSAYSSSEYDEFRGGAAELPSLAL